MQEYVFRSLDPAIFPLAKKFYKQFGQTTKTNRQDKIFAAFDNSSMRACLRITPYGEARLLRGVFVAPSYRGRGLGSDLIRYALEHSELNEVWTFPYMHLTALYETLNFLPEAVEDAPETIRHAFKTYSDQGKQISLMRWQHL
ncbi:hypothetical protein A3742_12215 [Oleiphilus sp. HI0071]|jgi:GNAT superfamily N-acetyltransferase|uniref:GNAT family N-acetyltransferase n=3 Tax=unclassified Oleiphilus TaxID=2631174 RepID=UPI0007C29AB0|nr:GNAT family N-acetyltransferase [Oleiphilus sp. HI0079]KZY68220.1 hypothetical protein A3737_02580 [Oleiphilus sp. HI0065]KZY81049.1 hypothetical protein A3742_12215 [Oleiphilus sp. HI0071]KZZ06290.1 hypothetical protein A3744_00475 [Oleiphilus sp. HI0073]KZZ42962.1 hypothetical protein A3758_05165 [Oleiphilus sp. HI0118]KZZ53752.1 hypothetical protein A3760_09550 [Oleiphilus sp. HI0122]KZZ71436.1 hypothetical protein A3765_02190 [Oleiphilus sp. HI0130]KZZ77483.1 hypothetical protein A376